MRFIPQHILQWIVLSSFTLNSGYLLKILTGYAFNLFAKSKIFMRLKILFYNSFNTLSGFIILLILFVSIGTIYSTFSLQQMNIEVRRFVNKTMLDLLVDWDESKFLTYTSDELQQHLTDKQLRKMNLIFIHLGELLNYQGANGSVFRSMNSWWHTTARYKVLASFQGGQFMAIITLIKENGNWIIVKFDYQYAFFPNRRRLGSVKLVIRTQPIVPTGKSNAIKLSSII